MPLYVFEFLFFCLIPTRCGLYPFAWHILEYQTKFYQAYITTNLSVRLLNWSSYRTYNLKLQLMSSLGIFQHVTKIKIKLIFIVKCMDSL